MSKSIKALLALNLTTAAFLVGAVVFSRALAGVNLGTGLTGAVWRVLAMLLSGGLALGGWRLAWEERVRPLDPVARLASALGLVAAPVLMMAVAAAAGSTTFGAVCSILLFAAATAIAGTSAVRSLLDAIASEMTAENRESVAAQLRPMADLASGGASSGRDDQTTVSRRELVQNWNRSVVDGVETIEAEVTAAFAAGERQTLIHLPVQPALSFTPRVECEPVDDGAAEEIEIEAELVTTFGVRLRVRRSGATGKAAQVRIAVMLTPPESSANAA